MPNASVVLEVTVRQAEYFVAAASTGTMTAAANQLHVSQAAVSYAIVQLEQRLGVQLFHRRRGHPLQLTADGQRALGPARDFLRAAKQLQQVTDDQAEPKGSISIGWYATLSPLLLPSVLDELRRRHPDLDLITTEGIGDELWAGLDARTLDAVIAYRLMVPDRFAIDEVCEVAPQVLLAAGHPLAAGPEVALSELAVEPVIVFDVPPSHTYLATLLGQVGAKPRVAHTSTNLETVRSLVARGEGYTIAVTPLADARSPDGLPIEIRPIADDVPTTSLVVVYTTPNPSSRTRAFLEACRTAAAESFAPAG
ncbi:MAG: LysR family transcriptional regulator [Acidimicrobiales bacterium]